MSPALSQRILESNNTLEITAWVSNVALNNPGRKTFLFLMIPEDFGGHRIAGPASPWDMEELRSLDSVNDAVRGAAFLSRFAAADQKHPVGIVTNLHSLHKDLYLGWPDLRITGDHLAYHGPLPRDCPCSVVHPPTTGCSGIAFNLSLVPILTSCFWARIFRAIQEDSVPYSLRDRGESLTSGPSPSSSLLPVSSRSFSLACTSGSLHQFFLAWSSLSLRDYADSAFVVKFLASVPDGPLSVGRSALDSRCQAFSLSVAGCSCLPLTVPSALCSRTSPIRSPPARSRSIRRKKEPLVSLRPRGSVGDGNVGRALGSAATNPLDVRLAGFSLGLRPHFVSTGCLFNPPFRFFKSVLGERFLDTPMVLPIRGHLDSIGRMMLGDYYIGRGCRQHGLSQSLFCIDFKVSVF